MRFSNVCVMTLLAMGIVPYPFHAIATNAGTTIEASESPRIERVETLRIESPATGTEVSRGDTVAVTVIAAPGLKFSKLHIVGTDGIRTEHKNEAPFVFSITIPKTTEGDEVQLFALATRESDDADVSSATPLILKLKPELPELPNLTYTPKLDRLYAGYPDGTLAIFSTQDGVESNVSNHTALSIAIHPPEVATITREDKTVRITPLAAGAAEITITNRDKIFALPIEVKPTVKGDFNADGITNAQDLIEIYGFKDKPAKEFPAMDLDASGTIDSADAELLKPLLK